MQLVFGMHFFIDFHGFLKDFGRISGPKTKDFASTFENAHLGEKQQKPAKNLGFYIVLGNIC